jgi:hypothetical protein
MAQEAQKQTSDTLFDVVLPCAFLWPFPLEFLDLS